MPYIIRTIDPSDWPAYDLSDPADLAIIRGEVDGRAVITLEEARGDCEFAVRAPGYTYPRFYANLEAAQSLSSDGGLAGPLPDGTVIEAERVSYAEIGRRIGLSETTIEIALADGCEGEIIDAYNAKTS